MNHFGSLASWAVSLFTVAMRIACNPRTLFSNLFVLLVAVVSRPARSISDTRSRWRWILMLPSVGFCYSESFFKGCVKHFEHHVTGNGCSHFLGVAVLYLALGERSAAEMGVIATLTASASLLLARGGAGPFASSSATSRNKMRRWYSSVVVTRRLQNSVMFALRTNSLMTVGAFASSSASNCNNVRRW